MHYFLLTVTIVAGVVGNINIKLSQGFTKKLPTVLVFVFYALCTYLLTLTVRYFEIGILYAIWSGVGITVVALVGVLFFHESKSSRKFIAIGLIICGVALLDMSTH
jgi:small multidrug resistance pump